MKFCLKRYSYFSGMYIVHNISTFCSEVKRIQDFKIMNLY